MELIINPQIYPLHNPKDPRYEQLLLRTKQEYDLHGIVTLPNFLSAAAIDETVKEIEAAKSKAWQVDYSHNIFFDTGDDHFDADHVRNRLFPTQVFLQSL